MSLFQQAESAVTEVEFRSDQGVTARHGERC
jgi:hypothetical protein